MKTDLAAYRYLEAAKREEVAAQLEAAGYEVARRARQSSLPARFDLVAKKNGERLAIEVVAQSQLTASMDRIRQLRQSAREQGFTAFRLVIVSPPRETNVRIEDLPEKLYGYLQENVPGELAELSPRAFVEEVSAIEFGTVEVTAEEIRVVGTGVVDVAVNSLDGEPDDEATWSTDFPFDFDIALDHRLEIRGQPNIRVDTSSFFDGNETPAVPAEMAA